MSADEFEEFKSRAKQVLGYMPIKTACVTCQVPDEKIPKTSKLPSRKCLIRQCVDKAGIKNCGYCSRFPCDTVKATADAWNRDRIEARLGSSLSETDYHLFVKPFEGLQRLEAIHDSLKSSELVEPPKVSTKTKLVNFPDNLPLTETTTSFKKVHMLLENLVSSSFGLRDADTFAQHHTLQKQRAHILRFLWILGKCGNLNDSRLVIDPKTYLDNRGSEKQLAIWSFVEDVVFKVLSDFGVRCERVALNGVKTENLTTGTGYLRNKGWIINMHFEKEISGSAALLALQAYSKKLSEKYGKKAFQRFCVADMQILSET